MKKKSLIGREQHGATGSALFFDGGAEQLAVGCEKEPDKLYPLQQFDMHFSDMTDLITRITPAELEILKLSSRKEELRFFYKEGVIACAPIPHPRQDICRNTIVCGAFADCVR